MFQVTPDGEEDLCDYTIVLYLDYGDGCMLSMSNKLTKNNMFYDNILALNINYHYIACNQRGNWA